MTISYFGDHADLPGDNAADGKMPELCMIASALGPSGGNTSAVAPFARLVVTPPAVTDWNCRLIPVGSLSAMTY